MKTIIILLIVCLPILGFGQFLPINGGILKAEVHGDSVIIKDDTAQRNCAALYMMEISSISSNTLKWLQKDIGTTAYCFCTFNLSVTIDSLKPGDYTVNTYYSYPNSSTQTYVGSVSFTISAPNSYLTPAIHSQYQSPCFTLGVQSIIPNDKTLKIFPNPANNSITISTNLTGKKIISISDLENNCIIKIPTEINTNVIDVSSLKNQMYFITVESGEQREHAKFIKN